MNTVLRAGAERWLEFGLLVPVGSRLAGHALRVLAVLLWLVSLHGCGAEEPKTPASADGPVKRDTRIVHQECAVQRGDAVRQDVNGDGRADITTLFDGKVVTCRAMDLNFDGIVDSWVYHGPGGEVRRRESDYDRDGRVDEIAIFVDGALREKHRATTLAPRLDTWNYYAGGKLMRTERDSDGNSIVDQWWEYPNGRELRCPLIHSDIDGDGRPDPGATVDSCGEGSGYVPPDRYEAELGGAQFEEADNTPTEEPSAAETPASDATEAPTSADGAAEQQP